MGVFSGKKVSVDTTVSRVVEENFIPDILQKTTLDTIFQGTPFTETLQRNVLGGSHLNFERMHRWAAEDGNYFYGLPDATMQFRTDGNATAIEVLKNERGQNITVDYMKFYTINNFHEGWRHLVEDYDYNYRSNVLQSLTGTKGEGIQVYLDKLVAIRNIDPNTGIYQDLQSWDVSSQSGFTPERQAQFATGQLQDLVVTEEIFITTTQSEGVEIHLVWIDSSGLIDREVITIDLSGYNTEQEYYQAKYKYVENGIFKSGYWTYDPVTGPYTQLNDVFADPTTVDPGTYFPFAVFRAGDTNRGDPIYHDTEAYKTTVKLLNFVGIDYQYLSDSIHENPDINDVDQAVMLLGVPITTTDIVQTEYLFKYFDTWHKRTFVDGDTDVITANEKFKFGFDNGVYELENNFAIRGK